MPPWGGGAVPEGLQQEAETLLGAFRGEAQSHQHTLLQLHSINTDGAAADLAAIHDHIVGAGAAVTGVALDHIGILQHGAGEGVVLRHVAPSSSLYSNSGNSVTHKRSKVPGSMRPSFWAR